jgi:hypothetical protein
VAPQLASFRIGNGDLTPLRPPFDQNSPKFHFMHGERVHCLQLVQAGREELTLNHLRAGYTHVEPVAFMGNSPMRPRNYVHFRLLDDQEQVVDLRGFRAELAYKVLQILHRGLHGALFPHFGRWFVRLDYIRLDASGVRNEHVELNGSSPEFPRYG